MSENDPLFRLVEIPLTDEERASGAITKWRADTSAYRDALAEINRLQVAAAEADIATKGEALKRLEDAIKDLTSRTTTMTLVQEKK